VILSWSYPSLTTAGASLGSVRRILVYRYVEELPAALLDAEAPVTDTVKDPLVPREVALFQRVPQLVAQQFDRLKERLDVLEAKDIPASTVGARLLFEDQPAMRTSDGRPIRVTYTVATESEHERSDLSNLASLVPIEPATAPANLSAQIRPEGVDLSWQRPTHTASGQPDPSLVGFNVYRFPAEGEIRELGKAVNTVAVTDTAFRDVPPYGTYRYGVTAVASGGPPLIESEMGSTIVVEFNDRLPPPAPANLATLAEESAIRLVWDAVDTPDFAGYKIYRRGEGARALLTPSPIQETNFLDRSIARGVSYVYEVTSVDQSGNESAPSAAAPAIVPR